jgi:4-hydroxy-3-polyprenylbenzoate decarboxylase
VTSQPSDRRDRIIVGISGSSGVIYGVRLLEALKKYSSAEIHLVISPAAEDNIRIETDRKVEDVKALGDVVYKHNNLAASISSGSFRTAGMIVVPCSMKSLSEIAYSNSNNLLARAADVCLKERRKLIIVPRETPLHKGHLEMLLRVADLGGVVLMPVPSFYHAPQTIDDVIDQTIGKILDQFDIEHDLFRRWHGG